MNHQPNCFDEAVKAEYARIHDRESCWRSVMHASIAFAAVCIGLSVLL